MKTIQGSKMIPIFIGRWTPKILVSLQEKPYRHGELRRRLQGVSQRMLTRTLRSLESSGLIAKSVTTSKRVAVEYSLTQLGRPSSIRCAQCADGPSQNRMKVSADVHLQEI
jgi:DNA-binding HxlR family transcriptional regulator